MSISPDLIKTMIPQKTADIANRVVYYGDFLATYNKLTSFLLQDGSSTAILRGDPGSGKKTLIDVVYKNFNNPSLKGIVKIKRQKVNNATVNTKGLQTKEIKMIYLHPSHADDDFRSVNRIAKELDMRPKSISDFIDSISSRKNIKYKGKLLIVLYEFEQFARQNQSLLYILTNLTQLAHDIKLLGVTMSLESTSNLEKRVRSRFNALFYELKVPYHNREEYLEFASKLLGGCNIKGDLKSKLLDMYSFGTRTITELKSFLCRICSWDTEGNLVIGEIQKSTIGINPYLERIFPSLVKAQKDLLIYACFYRNKNDDDKKPENRKFSLRMLHDYLSNNHKDLSKKFSPSNEDYIMHMEYLRSLSLISSLKDDEMIDENTKFTLEIKPWELHQVIKTNPECSTSNPIWTELR